MPKQKFRVYLAGPISDCNDFQKHQWRDDIKQKYGGQMDFLDPSEIKLRRISPYKIADADIAAIEGADGLLVNMWRESIGTAIGMVHAHRCGKPVVVANPNFLDSSALKFYAAAVEETPPKAAKALLRILQADAGWRVMKNGDREENFSREKLVSALRSATHSARQNNIMVPVLAMPMIIERLNKGGGRMQKKLSVRDINAAVLDSLAELEANERYASSVTGIAAKWKAKSRKGKTKRSPLQILKPTQINVPIFSDKNHATIWGKAVKRLNQISSAEARYVFQTIMQVEGITRIRLGPTASQTRKSICATVTKSKDQFIIDGNLFDTTGVKGTRQSFQVWVQHEARREEILNEIIAGLKAAGYWTN